MKKESYPTNEAWEQAVMEQLSEINEEQLLDLAYGVATMLCAEICMTKIEARSGTDTKDEAKEMLLCRIGRMAVVLDVLQLRYGDAAEYEQQFLEGIAGSIEE